MFTRAKTETLKQQPKTKAVDARIEHTKNGDTELDEKKLGRVAGGRLDPYKN
jgi:hypothetical protein